LPALSIDLYHAHAGNQDEEVPHVWPLRTSLERRDIPERLTGIEHSRRDRWNCEPTHAARQIPPTLLNAILLVMSTWFS
jgi:hypothetical protein